VVLLDLILPDLTGFEVLQEKGSDPAISAIPVMIVSSTDPSGVPIVSDQFTVYRANGISVKEFLDCLLSVSERLNSVSKSLIQRS
jgi:CheY-like chemotaxis protein